MLPTQFEREAIQRARQERLDAEAAEKERRTKEALDVEKRRRDKLVEDLVVLAPDAIKRAIEAGHTDVYLRIERGTEWTVDSRAVANDVIQRLQPSPGYAITAEIEHRTYTMTGVAADGGQGDEYEVDEYHRAVRITW